MKPFEFTATARTIKQFTGLSKTATEVGVWTDGIGVYCDLEPPCAYRLKPGVKYKITIEAVDEHKCHCADDQGGPCSYCMEAKYNL
jgi:hypothetical protein